MSGLWSDMKFGLRMLVKNPGFTAIAVFTLALGIGVNTAIFSVVNTVLLRPLPYPDPEQLVMLWETNPRKGIEQTYVAPPNFMQWKDENRAFENMTYWTSGNHFNLVTSDGFEKVNCIYAQSSFFATLGIAPMLGRALLPEEDVNDGPLAAVISYRFWQDRYAGRPDVLEQTVALDTYGRREYSIVGVMPPGFDYPNRCDLWLAAGWSGIPMERRGNWLQVLARLKPGVELEEARAQMSVIQARIVQQYPNSNGIDVAVVPLLEQTVGHNLKTALYVLWGIVGCVLLIACANVANLLLVHAAARQKEITLRLTLGASRWRVARQMLSESLLLGIVSGVAGVLLAYWSLHLLLYINPGSIPRLESVRVDEAALLFSLLISILTGVSFGMAPVWQYSKSDLNASLKDSSRGATGGLQRSRLRSSLVVSEIALSMVLLVCAGLMTRSFLELTRIDRGFQPEQLVTAELDFSVSGFTTWVQATSTRPQVTINELMERIRLQPGVEAVGAVSELPRGGLGVMQSVLFVDRPPLPNDEKYRTDFTGTSPGYFRAMGMPLLQGRDFTEGDVFEAPAVAIINETFAKTYFPNEDPVGKRISLEGRDGGPASPNPNAQSPWTEIVGVVRDVKRINLTAETVPQVYVPYWQWPMLTPTLAVRTSANPDNVASAIRSELKTLNPNLPDPVFRMMDEILSDTVAQPRFQTLLLVSFGLLALALAAVGIYGVMAYSVTQRTHEIGIRMALGAQRWSVVSMVVGQGMRLVLTGVVAGIAVALALTRVMGSLLFNVQPTDPITFTSISLLLGGATLLACYIPARRAAKVDPMTALRYE